VGRDSGAMADPSRGSSQQWLSPIRGTGSPHRPWNELVSTRRDLSVSAWTGCGPKKPRRIILAREANPLDRGQVVSPGLPPQVSSDVPIRDPNPNPLRGKMILT
jgi:hypothetical protein